MTINDISKDSFLSNRKFYDDKNYPRGLNRSGDFTLAEVSLIEKYGIALLELTSGKRAPATTDEEHFIQVIKEGTEPSNAVEKAWMKYQNKILTPKQFHTLFGSSKVDSDTADVETVELDID